MAKNNDKLNKLLRHFIDLELYANGVADEIEELMHLLYMDCDDVILSLSYLNTKNDYSLVKSVLKKYISDFEEKFETRLEAEAEKVKDKELDFLPALFGFTVGAITLSKILFTPFDGRDTIKSFTERTVKNITRTYDTALRAGYIFGQKASDVREQADKNLKQITNGVRNGIITAIPSFAKNTDRIIFLQNKEEVVWVATLDGKTCLTCTSLSGIHYKSVSEAPIIPHDRCRCILCPASEIKEPVPTFQEYINSLDEEGQKHALGPKRFELWKQYDMSLEKFLNDGRVIPLKDL